MASANRTDDEDDLCSNVDWSTTSGIGFVARKTVLVASLIRQTAQAVVADEQDDPDAGADDVDDVDDLE